MLSQQEAEEKASAHHGYRLVSKYAGMKDSRKATFFCPKHGVEHESVVKAVFRGSRLPCCHKEHAKAYWSERMKGSGNAFYGKTHSVLTREKISRAKLDAPHPMRGQPRPQYITDAIVAAIKGKPRPQHVVERMREVMRRRHQSFEYCARKPLAGKTAGKAGVFYVVRIDGMLKFGSATTTMAYRLSKYRQKYGAAELLLTCVVADAGAYESAMMLAHRSYWKRGEFFTDFLSLSD